ncbi:MAG: pilus assembly protein [Lachnospiraceae bacterium]|nr:pilus assembly protein [Lachnospiraceae bacterium]
MSVTYTQKYKTIKIFRKDSNFPREKITCLDIVKTLFFAPLNASLTVEAALVLPMFLFCMIAALQYCRAMGTAVQFGTALSETGKTLAAAAYAQTCIGDPGEGAELAVNTLSVLYAQNRVTSQVEDTAAVKNVNMAFSSLMQEDEMIDLVLTYQIRMPFGVVNLPGTIFIQRASVRAWVGRKEGKDPDENEEDEEETTVYVTATGTVYHVDPECTYLKLSVQTVEADALGELRNNSGEIYHACELCGSDCGSTVYITNEGNRYHRSLSCSGLKRTVKEVSLSEVGDLHVCSKCG